MPKPRVWQYAQCGTCKKALKWLDANGISYESVPIVDSPPNQATLRKLWKRSGLPIKRFFNTSGASYREGRFGDRLASMNDDEALEALSADGKLIKRPLIDGGDFTLVGFVEAEYDAAFGRKGS